jgi:hypothetical protein
MDQRELRETLARLHDELGRSRELDDASRELLERLAADIEARLHPDASDPPDALDLLSERLRGAITRFEDTHPALTTAIGRVADALASLGI